MIKKKNPLKTSPEVVAEQRSLSKSKTVLFYAVVVMLPLFLLFALEMLLREFHYESNLDSLVLKKSFHGKEYYSINQEVSKRYFASRNVGIPEPYEEVFEVNKSPKTFRIFCLGESTMYGYPYPSNVTAPRFLRDRLTSLFPDRTIEVVNFGIPAVSSAVVLDILKEAVRYRPDVIIIYSGHNEFYGTYGVASTEYLAQSKRFLDFYMQLRKLKLFQLFRSFIISGESLFASGDISNRRSTFLERMVEDKYIPLESSKYMKARDMFAGNLAEMVSVSKRADVPILLCTLVSNLKDLAPFISMHSPAITDSVRRQWNQVYQWGLEMDRTGMNEKATELFRQATVIDSMDADAHYHLAQCYLKAKRFEDSRREFVQAKDLDVLRFRASSEFNDIIRRASASDGAGVIDLDSVFSEQSPDHIVGNELITEHLHPDERGYFLMGKAFEQALRKEGRLVNSEEWARRPDESDQDLENSAAYTDLDLESANIRVQILKSAWPFKENEANTFEFKPSGTLQSVAFSYCEKAIGWDDAHYQIAKYFLNQGKIEDAAREYRTVSKELFLFYHPRMLLGDMQVLLHQYDKAEQSYLQALALDDNQFVRMRLGSLYLQRGQKDSALVNLKQALRIDDESSKKFTDDIRIVVLRELALVYEQTGAVDSAIQTARQIFSISPGNQTALDIIKRLEQH